MPEPTVNDVAPGGIVNLSDAPSGLDDATFDSLFPAEPAPITVAPKPEATPSSTVEPQAVAQPGQPSAPFLKGSKSVYNSPEAAVKGIDEKDALIDQLRQRYALTTGIDPITGQPIAGPVNQRPAEVDYYQSPEAYMKAAYDAVQKGSPQDYRDAQAKFMLDTLKPLQPVLQRAAREQAVEAVTAEIPDAKSFIGSEAYRQTLDSIPDLKDAIQTGEADHRFHSRLPGLYKIAYLAGQGRALPEILKAQAAKAAASTTPAQVRTTAQTSTQQPPQQTVRPSFKTIDGIRATIAEAEARGAKLDF